MRRRLSGRGAREGQAERHRRWLAWIKSPHGTLPPWPNVPADVAEARRVWLEIEAQTGAGPAPHGRRMPAPPTSRRPPRRAARHRHLDVARAQASTGDLRRADEAGRKGDRKQAAWLAEVRTEAELLVVWAEGVYAKTRPPKKSREQERAELVGEFGQLLDDAHRDADRERGHFRGPKPKAPVLPGRVDELGRVMFSTPTATPCGGCQTLSIEPSGPRCGGRSRRVTLSCSNGSTQTKRLGLGREAGSKIGW